MNGAIRPGRQHGVQAVFGHGPQAVRSEADAGGVQAGYRAFATLYQFQETVRVIDEAALCGLGRFPAEPALRIEDRQQRQANACFARRRGHGLRHRGEAGIRRAVPVMVEIVELTDRGGAGLEHFHIGLCGDGGDVFRGQAVQEAVHFLAPAPEAVFALRFSLRPPGHGALEGVAVHIGQAGQGDRALRRAFRRRVSRNGADHAIL